MRFENNRPKCLSQISLKTIFKNYIDLSLKSKYVNFKKSNAPITREFDVPVSPTAISLTRLSSQI